MSDRDSASGGPGGAYPGERRQAPRFVVDHPCTVYTGRHVHDGHLRDVSEGGAMLRGVPGLLAGDLLLVKLMQRPDTPFRATVRGVSLLGAHIAIEDPAEAGTWRRLIFDLSA